MLKGCAVQEYLRDHAHTATSCGRFARNGFKHCGRCLPCLVRRAAFHAWGVADATKYVYAKLSTDDEAHIRFDDVRSAAMAAEQIRTEGVDSLTGANLSSTVLGDTSPYKDVVKRGISELGAFLSAMGVK
jgi:hypothetical protein